MQSYLEKNDKNISQFCVSTAKEFLFKNFQSIVFNLEPPGHRLNKTKTTQIGH